MTRPLRVLVVEDELLIADHIALVLEEAGHTVVGLASSVDEALQILGTERPDVAVLDIMLSGSRNGIDLAVQMERDGMGVPHIFITGSGDPETKERAEATKPNAFIQKPFDNCHLLSAVAAAAAKSASN